MTKRTCTTCLRPKPLDADHWHRSTSDPEGFARACKPCVNRRIRRARTGNADGPEEHGPTLADVRRVEARAARRSADAMQRIAEQTRAVRPLRRAAAVLLVLLVGCATLQTRRECRGQCEALRGPVWSFGGPTIPGAAWDECMSSCELEGGDDDGR